MGNCQAIDNATLVIQHPSGRVDKLYAPVAAAQVMKANPGHYVALLLTTTVYSSSKAADAAPGANNGGPLRVTRIKLLRPTDTMILGHVYRLVTSQEVMKGLCAKKQAKVQQWHDCGKVSEKQSSKVEALAGKTDVNKTNQAKQERQTASRNTNPLSSSKHRTWQPALKSISEAAT